MKRIAALVTVCCSLLLTASAAHALRGRIEPNSPRKACESRGGTWNTQNNICVEPPPCVLDNPGGCSSSHFASVSFTQLTCET
jgi:hypothetical protein